MTSQPPESPKTRKISPRRTLLAVLVLVIALGGLLALGLAYGRPVAITPLALAPSPTASPTELVSIASPQRIPGVGGPQPLTPTPTATASTTPPPTLTASPTRPADTPTPTVTLTPLPPPLLTLQKLQTAGVPARDPYAITARLKLKEPASDLPRTTDNPPGNYAVGHQDVFNISDVENRNYYTITATVRQVSDHAYWYVQDGQSYDSAALKRLSQTFDKIYQTNHAIFGSEWTPGVDNDPRITVLFAPLRGAGGSYSAADEYTRAVNPFSNEREMFYISTSSGWGGLESTLAHEFQHMIHWHEHPNQDIWLNEGASVLASALNGYDVQGTDADFMRSPGVQLNSWQPSPALARPNYGASFLFLDYLWSRYGGDKVVQAVIKAPQPGTEAVDTALSSLGYKDSFTDVFEKWAIANLVSGHPGVPQEYTYSGREVEVSPQVLLDHYPTGNSGQIAQFGTTYVDLRPPAAGNSLHVDFSGQKETRVIGAPAHSGSGIYWSNRGDLADSTMTRAFDLTGVKSATLDCYLWYDIEQDFDYAYLEASTDGGTTWDTLRGRYTTSANPNGTNYGNAYTGKSSDKQAADPDGWLHEKIDLSAYAGKKILLRAEYMTDDGYNAQGFAIDDISIPEIGYRDNAESDHGWQGDGFVRVDNRLPQSYYLAVVRFKQSGVDVQRIALDEDNAASFDIQGLGAGGPYNRAVLVIAGLTPHNIERTTYDLSVRPNR